MVHYIVIFKGTKLPLHKSFHCSTGRLHYAARSSDASTILLYSLCNFI